jgi:hypothetical protein
VGRRDRSGLRAVAERRVARSAFVVFARGGIGTDELARVSAHFASPGADSGGYRGPGFLSGGLRSHDDNLQREGRTRFSCGAGM